MHARIFEFLRQAINKPATFAQAKIALLELHLQIEKEEKQIEQQKKK